MKKIRRIILSISLFVGVLILTGCTNKKPITSNDFYNRMKAKNFILTDVTDQYSEYPHMKKVYVAQSPDLKYQIEFCEIENDKMAKKVFESNKETFEKSLGNVVKARIDYNKDNVQKFKAISSGHFMAVTRINNTIIYVRVPQEYYKSVSSILKQLGY